MHTQKNSKKWNTKEKQCIGPTPDILFSFVKGEVSRKLQL